MFRNIIFEDYEKNIPLAENSCCVLGAGPSPRSRLAGRHCEESSPKPVSIVSFFYCIRLQGAQ